MMDMFYYCHLPGLPKKVKWPVKIHKQGMVYCRADNAYFSVNPDSLDKFPDEKLLQRGLTLLKKKPNTLKAFKDDVQWAEEHDWGEPEEEQDSDKPEEQQDLDKPEKQQDTGRPEVQQDLVKPEKQQDSGEPEEQQDSSEPEQQQDLSEPEEQHDSSEPEEQHDSSEPEEQQGSKEQEKKHVSSEPQDQQVSGELEEQQDSSEPEEQQGSKEQEKKHVSSEPQDQQVSGELEEQQDLGQPDETQNQDGLYEQNGELDDSCDPDWIDDATLDEPHFSDDDSRDPDWIDEVEDSESDDPSDSDEQHGTHSSDEPHGLGTTEEPHVSDVVSESDVSEISAIYPMLRENLTTVEMECEITEDKDSEKEADMDCEIDEIDSEKEKSNMENKYEERFEKVLDKDYPSIFVRKVVYSDKYNDKQKKNKRVQNSHHACYYCGKLKSHIQDHMIRKHPGEHEVKNIMQCSDKKIKEKLKDLLRAKGDNKHNKEVNIAKKGELILFRRPTQTFKHSDFGPCNACYEWMLTRSLPKHLKTCKGNTEACIPKKRFMKTMSDIEKGISTGCASKLLVRDVFTIMKIDNVGMVARSDQLIVSVGEKWMKSCIDNKVKRGYWASQHMRLAAKLLLCLRKLDAERNQDEIEKMNKSMWDYLRPAYVPHLHQAALDISLPEMDDIDDLKSPSNSIKIKYDLITMLEEKASLSSQEFDKSGDEKWKKFRKEAECVLLDTNRFWKTKVTKLARKVLFERKLGKTETLPSPKDLEKLGMYLKNQLSNAELDRNEVTWIEYKELMKYSQARLLIYNRRRSGEIENIRLKNYAVKLKIDDLDEGLMGEISLMERYLMDSHDLIQTRGKKSAIVPLLIPPECKPVLDFLADADVRKKVNVHPKNDFLFPRKAEFGPRRAYDSLAAVCSECELTRPEQLTSTNLRKYMATLCQVMNLAPNELQQVCRHLGHTTKVHLNHYRTMSPYIERVNIGKILLMQDLNLQSNFVGKKLEEVDFTDMLKQHQTEVPLQDELEACAPQGAWSVDGEDEELDEPMMDLEETDEEDGEERMEINKSAKPSKSNKKNRQRWTEKEVEEIHLYLGKHIESGKTPSKKDCVKAKQRSLKNGGELHRRYWHLIVKKVSAMIQKKKKN